MRKLLAVIVIVIAISGAYYWFQNRGTGSNSQPMIATSDFVTRVNHAFFTLAPGTTFTYEQKTDEGTERIVVSVTNETKVVMGIPATVVWDRVWMNDQLIEDTRDWYAQDRDGNVWYLGEDVDNYENGILVDHDGSWEAGVDGAQPGKIMLAHPRIGDEYRQEYYRGKAEDMGAVVALDASVTVPYGAFSGCLKTRDWTPLEPALNEHKYYCPEVGFTTLEESATDGSERVELISISTTKR